MLKILALLAVGLFFFVFLLAAKKQQRAGKHTPITSKIPLTENEQPMYFRLKETFPDHEVLAQVAFSALITAKSQATRSRFNRKVADFVLCTKAFEVKAIIELDDSSHRNREDRDGQRDKLLRDAGYKVLRYKRTPDAATLVKDIKENLQVANIQ